MPGHHGAERNEITGGVVERVRRAGNSSPRPTGAADTANSRICPVVEIS